MDLFGPMSTTSLGGKLYTFVIVDDYTMFTWALFLAYKDEAFSNLVNFSKHVQIEKVLKISKIRSNH